ncbi:MAG: DUF1905 domain-containing protein [Rhizobiaceae bacterium]
MSDLNFTFTAPLWLWTGKGAWHFITVPQDISAQIKMLTERRGFGSVRVTAEVNGHVWKTSIFPDAKSGCYFLPVKADVRKALGLAVGDEVGVKLGVDVG